MRSPTSQDRLGEGRWFSWTRAGIAGAVLLPTALWLCVAVLPQRLYPSLTNADLAGLSPADQAARREGRYKLQNDARTTLLQALAAFLVLGGAGIGASVTLRQVRIGREQLEQAREQAQRSDDRAREQFELAREGQVTERFTRAIDQLGHAQLDVRLGGIYALERIARDSPADRATIGEVLTAFVRSHAPWPPRLPGQYVAAAPIAYVSELQARAADVQACLTVLGRGGFATSAKGRGERLDLHVVDLRRANLYGTHLEAATLYGAHLEGANLYGAHLEGADLRYGVHLEGATLHGAHLEGADLSDAHLAGTDLRGAHLTGATLRFAHLMEAHLNDANLTGAQVGNAILVGADLYKANLKETNLEDANLKKASLILADLLETNLSRANLEGANLRFAHLAEANLTKARLKGAQADKQTSWPAGFDWHAAGVVEPDEEAPPPATAPPT